MTRYHPALVILHWLMALMIPVALAAGRLLLASMPSDSPDKVQGLAGHMAFGMAIGSAPAAPRGPYPQHPPAARKHWQCLA